MTRFVVMSDLHLHAWSYGSSIVNGRNSRLLDQVNLLAAVQTYLDENDIHTLIFTGDYFHTHSTLRSEVLWAAHTFLSWLKEAKINITFLIGNHDYADKEGDLHSLDFFKEFGTVVEKPGFYGDLFWAMSYTEDENKLKAFLDKTPKDSIVLLHQGLSQIPVTSKGFTINEILRPEMIPNYAAGAFVGHYHSRFKVKDRNIWSPGSPMQLTWTDTGEARGILDVFWTPGSIDVREVDLDSPRFVELTGKDISECENNFIRVRVSSSDDFSEIKEKVLKYGARSCEMVTPDDRAQRLEIPSSESFDSLPSLVSSYMDHLQLEAPVRKIGEQIMGGTYAPEKANSK